MDFNKKIFLMVLSGCFFGGLQAMNDFNEDLDVALAKEHIINCFMEHHEQRFPSDFQTAQTPNGFVIALQEIPREECERQFPDPVFQAAIADLYAGDKSVVPFAMYDDNGFFCRKFLNERLSRNHPSVMTYKTLLGTVYVTFQKRPNGSVTTTRAVKAND